MPVVAENLVGKIFDTYKPIKYIKSENGDTYWLCNMPDGKEEIKTRKFLYRKLAQASKRDSIIGKKFNMLEVLSLDHVDNRGHKHWLCKCECDNTKVFEEYLITHGKRKSCGCESKKKSIETNIKHDLEGRRFGRLTVISYTQNGKWLCKCDCGNTKEIARGSLTSGLTKSCGCLHAEKLSSRLIDITGQTFNNLTALNHKIVLGKTYWFCKCTCGNFKWIEQSHLTSGHTRSCGCLDLAHGGSAGENEIKEYLMGITDSDIDKENNILDGKEIDVYIEELNLGIEYNGSVYHASTNSVYGEDKPKNYHRDKFLCAKEKGIHLISIFDVDWDKNKDKIEMYLKSLVIPNKKLYARKCELRPVSKELADDFTDLYHIQGKARQNTINYGLYYNDELYAVMSFGALRLSKTNVGQFELHRYCVKDGYTIVGGANKLLKAFEREYNPTYVRSYSDNDYFIGGIYERLGFTDAGQCTPRYYWYYKSNEIKREKCMLKHLKVDYPELLQEAYNVNASNKEDYVMVKLGASKVYRSGNTKWEKHYHT